VFAPPTEAKGWMVEARPAPMDEGFSETGGCRSDGGWGAGNFLAVRLRVLGLEPISPVNDLQV